MHFGELRGRRRRRPSHAVGGAVAAVAAVAVLTGACRGAGSGEGIDGADNAPNTATGRFGEIHQGVCAAAQFSEAGDAERAADAFDDAHFGLHALVQALEDEDRAVATRLLEATERVENERTTEHLGDLAQRVAEGVEATGGTAPATCP